MTQLKKLSLLQWRLLLVLFLLINPMNYTGSAQELFQMMQNENNLSIKKLERLGTKYYKKNKKGKGSGYKLYMRNLYWAKRNADANGRVISDRQVVNEYDRFLKSWNQNNSQAARNVQRSSNWAELGPFNWTRTRSWSPGLGRITAIAVEPTNQKIIYAGSPGGGIWKSINAGQSWKPLGDRMTNMSIWAIAIDPNNSSIVYLGNSAGQIMKSTNGGDSWSEVYRVSGTPRRILIHPNSTLIFVGTTEALYRSVNSGNSFSSVLNSRAEDIEFKPGNTNVVYACGNSFYRSTNGGRSFSRITSGISRTERMKMAVTPANPDIVYLVQKRQSSFGYLYRSIDGGSSFSTRANYNSVSTNQVYFTQASRDMAIAVSDTNANEVHLGGMNYSRSLDGGLSFTTLAAWNEPNDRSYVHADIEVLQYIKGNIYIGTDGGIFRSRDRGANTTDLTQGGLAVRQYYRIGGAATDANMIVGGAQDNGTNIMRGANRQFKEWLGADGMECFIDHKNRNIVYGTTQFGSLYKSTDSGNSIGNISKPGNFSGEWVTPFMMDPINNNNIYVGYRDLYRSNNGGSRGSWRNLTSSINVGGNLDEMAIAASDNNYIYIAQKGRVWRTKNGQRNNPTWTEISNFRGDVNFITVDPNNPERVALAATGSRVYLSIDAGSTWTNIKGNLPNISAQCLVFDDTAANGLYVGMQSGVYYTNDNLSSWVPFSTNLPGVQTTDLEIHYPTRKIRVSTYGRGIWESDLYDENSEEINPPTDLSIQISEKDVTLTWKDNSTNENGFTIERSDGNAYERIDFVGTGIQTYTDKGLSNGTYTYRVRAYDSDSYSSYSNTIQAIIEDIVTPPDVIDNCEGCTVYDTNSEEISNADHSKEKAADGDPSTYWHSNWYDDNTSHPHFIAIDLGQQRDLVGFSYQGRQTGTTGMVKDYIIFGWDGNSWQQLSTGTFQKSTLKQTVEFDTFRCRYIYFRALSEVDDKRWASVAEFTVRYTPSQNAGRFASKKILNTPPPAVDLSDFDGIKVFPIPFNDKLTIKGITSKKAVRSIQLIGTNGRTQRTKNVLDKDIITIDTHKLLNGFYVLHIEQNGVQKSIKVFKQK
ncbi:discoidin domain-containing protein [Aquimarina algiphila]|uniref:discoidin domain-containing protein n=1 Tax=Aquimarina algiphila TaxID=2047982 RepID=UPI00248FC865|nr:discoidin domain-containing protein [Aquimarina algiphila]